MAVLPTAAAAARAERSVAGVFPIAFTPARPDGTLDYDGIAAQVAFCRRGGVHGLAWPQIASGWTTLSERERIQGAEVMAEAARGGSTALVIGVQSRTADLVESERYARHAERIGADAIICIPPASAPPAALLELFGRLADATALPIFVQAVGDFSVDRLVELHEAVPAVRYVKDEAGDPLARVGEIARRTGGALRSFSGRGVATMIAEMEAGFAGHCPFTSLADLYASAYDAFHAGRKREAFEQFGRIQAAASMFAQSNIEVLIARGVIRAGTVARMAPAVPGIATARVAASTADQIRRVLDTYLAGSLRG